MTVASPAHSRPFRIAPGFTLIELLVVVGILALLASIFLVVGSRAFRAADSTRIGYQLQTIEKALDAYKTDFGSFPTTDAVTVVNVSDELNRDGLRGARTLCKALVAPTPQGAVTGSAASPIFLTNREDQDGNDGPGFRVPPRSGVFKFKTTATPMELEGKVYGPYIQGNAITWSKTTDGGQLDPAKDYDDTSVLLDANENVILYYPVLNAQPALSRAEAYVGAGPYGPPPASNAFPLPMYRSTDNSKWIAEGDLRRLLGDSTGDGAINNSAADKETAVVKGKYLLISAGRDGVFGPNPSDKNKTNDDVTNFGP